MSAIKLLNVSRYFEPMAHVGQNDGRSALRTLLAIVGVKTNIFSTKGPLVTHVAGGHVLKNISLEIARGSVVCITGASGSGKTTLLKLLAGVLLPTAGRIELDGYVSALIDVADDLEPNLTGLENIERHLRYRRTPDARSIDFTRDVIAFSGIEGFENVSVARYSTGMRMRLGFALALQGRPDILLIDDVLGVGDMAFQQQCVERINALREAGCTLVLVSTDKTLMLQLGCRVIVLSDGRVSADGPVSIGHAPAYDTPIEGVSWQIADLLPQNDVIAVHRIEVSHQRDDIDASIEVAMELRIKQAPQLCRPAIDLTMGGLHVMRSLYPKYVELESGALLTFLVKIPLGILSEGTHHIEMFVVSLLGSEVYSLKSKGIIRVSIKRQAGDEHNIGQGPVLVPEFSWEVEALAEAASA
jgi:ABC-type polysaccharide/polyol phosphate transport system ATPase subunit